MLRALFWIFSSLLAALVVHLSYILFVPSRQFNASIDLALKDQTVNAFAILDDELQLKLMPFVAETDLVILCKYDVSKRPVRLTMEVPEGYWSLAVYTIRGRQLYALNDRQADARTFSVTLEKSPGFFGQFLGGGAYDLDVTSEDIGWHVALPDDRGLAYLWMPQSDKWRKREARAVLEKSKCAPVDKN